ncbi:MAG: polyhydroxyalkanoate synthesis repressor PhaR [Parvularculaceae bacterium]|nr:polyhydroxyalkanoate synthesis repressor PhaR [Parvularculaceae bacterium]
MSEQVKPDSPGEASEPIVIKKYANRRLYNTATSAYVTLDYLSDMVKGGQDFVVFDAKTGENITRSVLTQIIVEEEGKGQNLLPIQFLRQLIKFYGDSLQMFLPSYLEMSMDAFARNQEKLRGQMRDAFGGTPGFQMFEETARKNMALYEQAVKMFTPMTGLYSQAMQRAGFGSGFAAGIGGAPATGEVEDINALKAQLATLQRQIDKLEKKG